LLPSFRPYVYIICCAAMPLDELFSWLVSDRDLLNNATKLRGNDHYGSVFFWPRRVEANVLVGHVEKQEVYIRRPTYS
jgi:hypothetical protein